MFCYKNTATNKLILAIKPDTFLKTQEINLITLYSNNCKKIRLNILLKQSKKANHFFFFTLRTMLYLPLSLFIFISLLLHNFIIFPPQFFFIPSCTILLFSLLNFFFIPSFTMLSLFPPWRMQITMCKGEQQQQNKKQNIKSEILQQKKVFSTFNKMNINYVQEGLCKDARQHSDAIREKAMPSYHSLR